MYGEAKIMQKLNLRTPKPFDYSKESGIVLPRAKFFCVSEGPTEESYFLGVKNNKKELEIKNDVVIEIIKKEEGQESYSHPEQLIKASLFYMGRIDEQGNDIPKEKWEENLILTLNSGCSCIFRILSNTIGNYFYKIQKICVINILLIDRKIKNILKFFCL